MAGTLTRWSPFGALSTDDPFTGMLSLRNAMDRLFQDAFVPGAFFGWGETGYGSLALDVYETDDDVVVTAAVPGIRPEDVDISVQGNVLTIRGEIKSEEDGQRGNYHLRERRYGSFQRHLQLPVAIQADRAEARFENGILRLSLPKAEEARERKIQVTAGSGNERTKSVKAA